MDVVASVIAVVLALPVVSVAASVFGGDSGVFRHLAETVLAEYVLNTALLGTLVLAGVLAIGAPTAWLVARCDFPGRRVLEAALILPLAAPAYVLAYAYADFLSAYGPVQGAVRAATGLAVGDYWFPEVRSLPGAAAMLVLVLYPYVYLLARARFLSESAAALDAARMLGRSQGRAFLSVSLPLARPALAAGAALALMETLADYGTVSYFGVPVFTTGIYRAWFSFGDPAAAAKLAAGLILFVALALMLEKSSRGGARFHEAGRREARPARVRLHGARAAGAVALCAAPVLLGFVVPALVLANLLLQAGLPEREFTAHVSNSVTLAAAAGVVAVCVAFILAYARKERPHTRAGRAAAVATGLIRTHKIDRSNSPLSSSRSILLWLTSMVKIVSSDTPKCAAVSCCISIE